MLGVIDSAVFQRTVDFPDEYAPGSYIISVGPVGADLKFIEES